MALTYNEFKKQYKTLFLKAFNQSGRVESIQEWDALVDFEELYPTYTQKLDCYEEWITIFPANKTSDSNRSYFGR
jgi:hypothetical protein